MARSKVLLIPGHLCDARMWAGQVGALAAYADAATVTLPAFDSISEFAASALAQHGGRLSVVGFSLGGYVAMEMVRQSPDRIERLALLDTLGHPETAQQTERRKANFSRVDAGQYEQVRAEFTEALIGPVLRSDEKLCRVLREMVNDHSTDVYRAQQCAMMRRPDVRDDLKRIRCHTIVVCGEDDVVTPPRANREIAASIPGACYIPVAGAGHMTPMEQPVAISSLLRYWVQQP